MSSTIGVNARRWFRRQKAAQLRLELAHVYRVEADALAVGPMGIRRRPADLTPADRDQVEHLDALARSVEQGINLVALWAAAPPPCPYAALRERETQRERLVERAAAALARGVTLVAPRHTAGPWPGALFVVIQDPGCVFVQRVDAAHVAGHAVPCPTCGVRRSRECIEWGAMDRLCAELGQERLERELQARGRDALRPAFTNGSHAARIEAEKLGWISMQTTICESLGGACCGVAGLRVCPSTKQKGRFFLTRQGELVADVMLDELGEVLWKAEVRWRAANIAAACFVGERGAGLDGAAAALERCGDMEGDEREEPTQDAR